MFFFFFPLLMIQVFVVIAKTGLTVSIDSNVLTVSLFFFFFPLFMIQVFVVIAKTGLYFLLKIFEK